MGTEHLEPFLLTLQNNFISFDSNHKNSRFYFMPFSYFTFLKK